MVNTFKSNTNRLFVITVLTGISYFASLVILSVRSLPGFFMQSLFLVDALINTPEKLITLVTSLSFIESMIFGMTTIVLLVVAIKGVRTSFNQVTITKNLVKSLKIKSIRNNIVVLKSKERLVFTAGFLNPKVYISDSLQKMVSKEQYDAIMLHEKSHCEDSDPLRSFIVSIVANMLPRFPFKSKIINYFDISVELKCDEHSETILGSKRPLIEALYAIIVNNKMSTLPLVNYFAESPERIPVLVGAKKYNFKLVSTFASLFLFVVVSFPVFAYSVNLYNCAHIEDCIAILVKNVINKSSENLCAMHDADIHSTCISQ